MQRFYTKTGCRSGVAGHLLAHPVPPQVVHGSCAGSVTAFPFLMRLSAMIVCMFVERIAQWGQATFRPPAGQEAISACAAALGRPLPDELRELLAETNGVEGEYGLEVLWSAERIHSGRQAGELGWIGERAWVDRSSWVEGGTAICG
ncbi:SMI1/KNR4 family protein [Kribbella sp. NBC_01505]|uniref:SMI1/KNR4 family protein n=1 Tax=Kribbella sp. NBC_01505 TaxID=2903580 RepID=UPI00386E07F2